jgi:hypothetical protein
VGCVPAIKDVCGRAGSASLPEFSRVNLGIAGLVTDNSLFLVAGVLLALFLLEWRVSNWPRYRRAAVGLAAFIVNSSLLISLLLIIATGAIVARIALQAAG